MKQKPTKNTVDVHWNPHKNGIRKLISKAQHQFMVFDTSVFIHHDVWYGRWISRTHTDTHSTGPLTTDGKRWVVAFNDGVLVVQTEIELCDFMIKKNTVQIFSFMFFFFV